MKIDITKYDTIAFDCDGVILDSNKVKTDAFYHAMEPLSKEAAIAIRDYHVKNGGISRFKKFEWAIKQYLNDLEYQTTYERLLDSYAKEVESGLLNCQINPALDALKESTQHANWLVVSGGAQVELRDVFERRNLTQFFSEGIYGSPDSKDVIFSRELSLGTISGKSLFIGDSKYDYISSNRAGLDFVFVSEWTEVQDWREFCCENNIPSVDSLSELII